MMRGLLSWGGLVLALLVPAAEGGEPLAGEIFAFGVVGGDAKHPQGPTKLGAAHAQFVERADFRSVGVGRSATAVIEKGGFGRGNCSIYKFDDISPNATLKSGVGSVSSYEWCQVCRGLRHTVGVTCDGDAYMWGIPYRNPNDPGEDPMPGSHPREMWYKQPDRIVQVSCGDEHTLMLTEARDVYAFGNAKLGRLGLDNRTLGFEANTLSMPRPQKILDLSYGKLLGDDTVCSVEASGAGSFAITQRGDIFAWGDNAVSQLGLPRNRTHGLFYATPQLVQTEMRACEVAAGPSYAVAYDQKGEVWTWGGSTLAPLMHGATLESQNFFGGLEAEERPVQLAAGDYHVAMLLGNGSVFAFGYDRYGQLGMDLQSGRRRPAPADGGNVTQEAGEIWTLSPHLVQYLEGLNVSAVYAAGNYTVAHRYIKAPHNCKCARGGRGGTVFGVPGTHPVYYVPKKQVKQPDLGTTHPFGPVSPNPMQRRIPLSEVIDGEVIKPAEKYSGAAHAQHHNLMNAEKVNELPLRVGINTRNPMPTGTDHHRGSVFEDAEETMAIPQPGSMRGMPPPSRYGKSASADSVELDSHGNFIWSLGLQDHKTGGWLGDASMRSSSIITKEDLQRGATLKAKGWRSGYNKAVEPPSISPTAPKRNTSAVWSAYCTPTAALIKDTSLDIANCGRVREGKECTVACAEGYVDSNSINSATYACTNGTLSVKAHTTEREFTLQGLTLAAWNNPNVSGAFVKTMAEHAGIPTESITINSATEVDSTLILSLTVLDSTGLRCERPTICNPSDLPLGVRGQSSFDVSECINLIPGDVCTVVCDSHKGYRPLTTDVVSAKFECDEDGSYALVGSAPLSCSNVSGCAAEGLPAGIDEASHMETSDCEKTNVGAMCTVTCAEGYKDKGLAKGLAKGAVASSRYMCNEAGNYEPQDTRLNCTARVYCSLHDLSPQVRRVSKYDFTDCDKKEEGETCEVECKDGYEPVEDGDRSTWYMCTYVEGVGSWEYHHGPSELECKETDKSPQEIPHAVVAAQTRSAGAEAVAVKAGVVAQ